MDKVKDRAQDVGTDGSVGRLDLGTATDADAAAPTTPGADRSSRPSRRGLGLGDEICAIAEKYGARTNKTEFATSLRGRTLPKDRYLGYIAGCYPVVVGFNRGLVHSLRKVDHVRDSIFLNSLAAQLQEEQFHNQLWRTMLGVYDIDAAALYRALEGYMAGFTTEDLDRLTRGVLAALRSDLENVSPGIFPDPVFPEPVLALYHHMWMTGSYDGIPFWEHYGGQYGMEVMILDFVSTSFYPGIVGNPELDLGPKTTTWWKEHARQGAPAGQRSTEEKHLELAKIALNRRDMPSEARAQVRMRAEDTLRLFTATMISHDQDKSFFSINAYRSCKD